jgi:hypothetical protein
MSPRHSMPPGRPTAMRSNLRPVPHGRRLVWFAAAHVAAVAAIFALSIRLGGGFSAKPLPMPTPAAPVALALPAEPSPRPAPETAPPLAAPELSPPTAAPAANDLAGRSSVTELSSPWPTR